MAKTNWITFGVLVTAFAWTGFEVVAEEEEVTSILEFILDTLEKALIIVGAGGVFFLLKNSREQQQERKHLANALKIARVEGQNWRHSAQTYMNGLGKQIENQFYEWKLSEAEREVGLLMIKGFSHKEIADLRGTAEATVRQQARNIYQKSNLPSKAAFCAYFLEDLLPPQQHLFADSAVNQ